MDYGVFGMIVLILEFFFFDLPCSVPFEFEKTSYTSF